MKTYSKPEVNVIEMSMTNSVMTTSDVMSISDTGVNAYYEDRRREGTRSNENR